MSAQTKNRKTTEERNTTIGYFSISIHANFRKKKNPMLSLSEVNCQLWVIREKITISWSLLLTFWGLESPWNLRLSQGTLKWCDTTQNCQSVPHQVADSYFQICNLLIFGFKSSCHFLKRSDLYLQWY